MGVESITSVWSHVIEDGKGDTPEPAFGITIRAMNEWSEERLREWGTLVYHPGQQRHTVSYGENYLSVKVPQLNSWQPAYIYEPTKNLRDTLNSIRPNLWEEVKDLDMAVVENWIVLANVLGQPYHIKVITARYEGGFSHAILVGIFNGVVIPDTKLAE